MEIYPHAKVICTMRDPDDWWRLMEPLIRNAKNAIPLLRLLPATYPLLLCYVL